VKKAVVFLLSFFVLTGMAFSQTFYSIQLGSFLNKENALNFYENLDPKIKAFVYYKKPYYTVRAYIFVKRSEAESKLKELMENYGLTGVIVKTNPENLVKLFKEENYEEFVSLFENIPLEKLSADLLYYLGTAFLRIGDYKNSERYLERSAKLKNEKALKKLAKLFTIKGDYKKLRKLAKQHKGLIKHKKFVNVKISCGVDTNVYLIPEDMPLKKGKKRDYYRAVSVNMISTSPLDSYAFFIYAKNHISDSNRKLDVISLILKKESKLSPSNSIILPEISYVYSMNKHYSLNVSSGLKTIVWNSLLTFKLGVERNYRTRDRDAFITKASLNNKFFSGLLLFRNYKKANNKFYSSFNLKIPVLSTGKVSLRIFPGVKFVKYAGSTKSTRPFVNGILSFGRRKQIYLRGGYEKNYATKEELEWDYKKCYLEFGVSFNF